MTNAKTHYRSTLRFSQDAYDAVLAHLYMVDMQGCEEIGDAQTDAVTIKAYFTSEAAAHHAAIVVTTNVPGVSFLGVEAVLHQDWNAEWRKTMQPAALAPSWWVSPLWLPPPSVPNDHWIKIEPKMAFGTGHHETTRLAAQALIAAKENLHGRQMLDIGTGSGVLCFTGAFLGAAWCLGIEIDGDCRENLAENRSLNSDAGSCSFVVGTPDALTVKRQFDVIVMNMIHTESAPQLARCKKMIAPGGILVWSGILSDEYRAACTAAAEEGFSLRSAASENEWWCGVFGIM